MNLRHKMKWSESISHEVSAFLGVRGSSSSRLAAARRGVMMTLARRQPVDTAALIHHVRVADCVRSRPSRWQHHVSSATAWRQLDSGRVSLARFSVSCSTNPLVSGNTSAGFDAHFLMFFYLFVAVPCFSTADVDMLHLPLIVFDIMQLFWCKLETQLSP